MIEVCETFSCYQGVSPRKPFECDSEAAADIVLLVDGSWSIGRTNFRRVREFLESLMIPFHIGPNHIQIGEGQKDASLPPCVFCSIHDCAGKSLCHPGLSGESAPEQCFILGLFTTAVMRSFLYTSLICHS